MSEMLENNEVQGEKKHLSFKECFNKDIWKENWKSWVPKAILFSLIGFILVWIIIISVFTSIIQYFPELIVGVDNYVPFQPEGLDYYANLNEFVTGSSVVVQYFTDLTNTLFSGLGLYALPIGIIVITFLFGFLFLYANLRTLHDKKKKDKGYDSRVWIRDSRKLVKIGDDMMIGKGLETHFTWDNKKERPSGMVIGSVFVDDKDYERLSKDQKMTPKVLESLKDQAKPENWKPLPKIDDWAKKYNDEKKKITDGVNKNLTRTDIVNLKKDLKKDKFLAYDILNKKLLLKKKKLETLKQIELIKNANSKNLKVKKSK